MKAKGILVKDKCIHEQGLGKPRRGGRMHPWYHVTIAIWGHCLIQQASQGGKVG